MTTSEPGLLDQLRNAIRLKHYSYKTEKSYISWVKRFVLFHQKKHPKYMGTKEVNEFLTHLTNIRNVAASTQNQALNALVFLFKYILDIELVGIDAARPKKPKRLPEVMTLAEVKKLINCMQGNYKLMALLIYGGGLRLMECLRLRIKDVDFNSNLLIIRDAKGFKDRTTILAKSIIRDLISHISYIKKLHERKKEKTGVLLPYALAQKYPNAPFEWA